MSKLQPIIEAIHATKYKVVIEFAGAGAQALRWLHGVGGSSRTVLEATDRYAAASLSELLGYTPTRFTSLQVAQDMAVKAFLRASHLAQQKFPVSGIGCTATITTDRLKKGEHRVYLARCDEQGITSYAVTMIKGARTRKQEEKLVSRLILQAVVDACQLEERIPLKLKQDEEVRQQFEAVTLLARLLNEEIEWLLVLPDGRMTTGQAMPNIAVLSGSFNPLHGGHRGMAAVAAELLGQTVYYEMPLINADKAPLTLAEASRRLLQFAHEAPLILTRSPLFSQKAELFPGTVFIVGADTAKRLLQPRFYNDDPHQMYQSFDEIAAAGGRFLVAGRLEGQTVLTLDELSIPERYQPLFQAIPTNKFRLDISSTALRNARY